MKYRVKGTFEISGDLKTWITYCIKLNFRPHSRDDERVW
jgi:hypothetical protein